MNEDDIRESPLSVDAVNRLCEATIWQERDDNAPMTVGFGDCRSCGRRPGLILAANDCEQFFCSECLGFTLHPCARTPVEPVAYGDGCMPYAAWLRDVVAKNIRDRAPPRVRERNAAEREMIRPAQLHRHDDGGTRLVFHDGLAGRIVWWRSRFGSPHAYHWIDLCGIHCMVFDPPSEAEFDAERLASVPEEGR